MLALIPIEIGPLATSQAAISVEQKKKFNNIEKGNHSSTNNLQHATETRRIAKVEY